MKKNFKLFILAIVSITLLTRFIGLNVTPPHLSNDEISIAYDAFSVSKTLRDEHNQFLPISFQSHGTHKAPLTIYLTSFSVLLLGNSEFSARVPSAILGSLTILLLGLLVYELTKNEAPVSLRSGYLLPALRREQNPSEAKNTSHSSSILRSRFSAKGDKILALFAGAVLSITPWHIYTSRMALETNVALFFLVGGIYFFFYAIGRNKSLQLITSFIFFALSMYAYHTEWGLTPLIIGVLFLIYRSTLLKKKAYFAGLILFVLLVIPLATNFLNNRGTNARANTEFLFTQDTLRDQLKTYPDNYFRQGQIILSRFIATYSSYIEPEKIFFASPNLLPKENPFQAGLILAPFLPMFFYGLFKIKKYFGKHAIFIYLWLILSPIVPALTVGEQQVVRNLPFLAPAVLVIATGCYESFTKFRKNKLALISYSVLVFISFFYFSLIYYYHYPKESGINFQYGYKQIAEFIKPRYDNYDKIIIDPIFGEGYVYSGLPYLYVPYFTSLDPKYLQGRGNNNLCGNCFAKYEIRGIEWKNEILQGNSLYIVPDSNKPPEELSKQLGLISEIVLPNKKPAFAIYESK